ncbi:hypothetical protein LY76DRAFT_149619 [Colletotrichum caudatum]|nr:hypothetical protein LY76DRAFT_149619 [Colletotrichum caudatum]
MGWMELEKRACCKSTFGATGYLSYLLSTYLCVYAYASAGTAVSHHILGFSGSTIHLVASTKPGILFWPRFAARGERGVPYTTLRPPHLFVVTAGFAPSRLGVLKLLHLQFSYFLYRTCFPLKPCPLFIHTTYPILHTRRPL